MATRRRFQNMLNEYITVDLMNYELEDRNYIYKKVEKDESWLGGNLPVPFEGAQATTFQMDSLAEVSDIAQDTFVRGNVSEYKEAWGSMIFNYKDLQEHGKLSEQNFLKILPGRLERFMNYIGMMTSIQMTKGPHFAEATANGTNAGVLAVDRIDRFNINQKIALENTTGANNRRANFYVTNVDVNGSRVTLSSTRGGGPANLTVYTNAADTRVYLPGVTRTNNKAFASISEALLTQANGGTRDIVGQRKTDYPYLQAVNIPAGAAVLTPANILQKIFDGYTEVKIKAKDARIEDVMMDYKNFGLVMSALQQDKSAFKIAPNQKKVEEFGYSSVSIMGVDGRTLKFTAIQEMPSTEIFYMDWSAFKLYSNGGFKKVKTPDGLSYYTLRATTGYQFVCDMCFFGELVPLAPAKCAILHGIKHAA